MDDDEFAEMVPAPVLIEVFRALFRGCVDSDRFTTRPLMIKKVLSSLLSNEDTSARTAKPEKAMKTF